MCGIVGGIGELRAGHTSVMLDSIAHRGPDSAGQHIAPHVATGAVRLAIVGIPGGSQPIPSADGQHSIVFNGEIYNHRELRSELRQRGHRFRSTTDSEVVLRLYLEYGAAGLRRLRGMYAFCIAGPNWIFLARDRLGIKPLYTYRDPDGRTLLFASEIKALLRSASFRPVVDMTAVADWLLVGQPCGDLTFVEQIRAVPPGTCLRITRHADGLHEDRTSIADEITFNHKHSRDELAESIFESELGAAVKSHFDADVEVGIALSGGIDSSLLATMAPRGVPAFTVAEHADDGDLTGARALAHTLECEHHEQLIDTQKYFAGIARTVVIEEQPAALGGLPLLFLCRAMASRVKCAVIGEGADELFGGYREYLDPAQYLDDGTHRLGLVSAVGLTPSDHALELVALKAEAGTGTARMINAFHANLGNTLVRRHLEIVDKYSMAAGLELRVPFLADEVYRSALAVPLGAKVDVRSRTRKVLLREILRRRLGAAAQPILDRPKQGFPASGIRHIASFAKYCDRVIGDDYNRDHPLGAAIPTKYMLVMYDLFEELMLRHAGQEPDGFDLADFVHSRSGARGRMAS